MLHLMPSQCSTSVRAPSFEPTAHISLADTTDTPARTLSKDGTLGLVTTRHCGRHDGTGEAVGVGVRVGVALGLAHGSVVMRRPHERSVAVSSGVPALISSTQVPFAL